MNADLLLLLLIISGVIAFGWLCLGALRASKEEREWEARMKRIASEAKRLENERNEAGVA